MRAKGQGGWYVGGIRGGYNGGGGRGGGVGGRRSFPRASCCQYYSQQSCRRYFLIIKLIVLSASKNENIDIGVLMREILRMSKDDAEMERVLRMMSGEDGSGTIEAKFFMCIHNDVNQFARISGSMKLQQPSVPDSGEIQEFCSVMREILQIWGSLIANMQNTNK